jgi:hypothetical protein
MCLATMTGYFKMCINLVEFNEFNYCETNMKYCIIIMSYGEVCLGNI